VNGSHPVNAEVKLCGASTSPLLLYQQVVLVLGQWSGFMNILTSTIYYD